MGSTHRFVTGVRVSILASMLAPLLTGCAPGTRSERAGSRAAVGADLAIQHVSIVDVTDGTILTDQTVLVAGNRIVAVGPAATTRPAAGARVVEGSGKYLIPGLWDMHVHSAASPRWHFPLFLAHGVTGVRNMHTTVDTALELTRSVKRRLAVGTLLGPRFLANGGVVDGPVPVWPGSVRLGSAEAARAAVDSLSAAGADFIKVYQRLPREAYLALADQARRRGIPFVGHVPNALTAIEAADAGQRSIEHVDGLTQACSSRGDSIRAFRRTQPYSSYEEVVRDQDVLARSWSSGHCAPTIEALRRNGTWFTPTLVLYWAPAYPDSVLANAAATAAIPPSVLQGWRTEADDLPPWRLEAEAAILGAGRAMVVALHRAGVALLAGTDVGNPFLVPGLSLHTELELLVQAGLTPLVALQAATIEPARFLQATDSLGTVAPGMLADLVLLDANPLDDISNTRGIHGVVTGGRYLDRETLDALIASASRSSREP